MFLDSHHLPLVFLGLPGIGFQAHYRYTYSSLPYDGRWSLIPVTSKDKTAMRFDLESSVIHRKECGSITTHHFPFTARE